MDGEKEEVELEVDIDGESNRENESWMDFFKNRIVGWREFDIDF